MRTQSLSKQDSKDANVDIDGLRELIFTKKRESDPGKIEVPAYILKKANHDVFNHIKEKARKNFQIYKRPSQWKSSSSDEQKYKHDAKLYFKKLSSEPLVYGKSINTPIQIGDLVTLGTESLRVYLVTGLPKTFGSRIVTLASDMGQVIFAHTSTINCRIPGAIPSSYERLIKKLVSLERKSLDIEPVGVPDPHFSKSKEALPVELQNRYVNDHVNQIESEETELDPNNFLMAQASAKLLVNSPVQTFLIHREERAIFCKGLLQVANEAFGMISQINLQLEKLHRVLQRDATGELNAPRTVSIFELLYKLDECKATKEPSASASASLAQKPADAVDYDSIPFSIPKYLAVVFALRKQSRLWTIQKDPNSPSKVTIWPMGQISHVDATQNYLENSGGIDEIAEYCVDKLIVGEKKSGTRKPPVMYQSVIEMLKEYINGKYDNNAKISTMLVALLRRTDALLLESGVTPIEDAYKFEYSFGKAFDLLTKLNDGKTENPVKWSREADLAGQRLSPKADLRHDYYRYFDDAYSATTKDEFMENCLSSNLYHQDPMASSRVDMTDECVYCIDEPTAHEIDDGISISEVDGNDDKYVISIHIAEPSSYIRPDSVISSIAFDKSSTSYFPEDVFPMLPKSISNIAGLGVNGQETRTFVIQYKLSKKDVDDFIRAKKQDPSFTPNRSTLQGIQQQIDATGEIKFALAKRFRQGFTYDAVNKLLDDHDKSREFLERGNSSDADFNNLLRLSHVSKLLRQLRMSNGAYFGSDSNSSVYIVKNNGNGNGGGADVSNAGAGGKLTLALPQTNDTISIKTQNQQGASTELVTENMIIANYLMAKVASEKGIKILYKCSDPKFSPDLRQEFQQLLNLQHAGEDIPSDKLVNLYGSLTRTFMSDEPGKHFLMGLKMYSNVSSPLRRYIDMVNQWKFQDHYLSQNTLSDESIPGIISRLNARSEILRSMDKRSKSFWQALMLKMFTSEYISPETMAKDLDLQISLLASPARTDLVAVNISPFGNVRSHIEVSKELLADLDSGMAEVGGILDPTRLTLKKIDIIENEAVFEYR
ncbi:uncharacterized protein LODBEIA_P35810 [Lodderomyces beijingensis]|uniref:RNB domain-containing protein n=1 Tax=Lodderomyces beijingensis TaxID=1775926 RepID=A0ABP0ZMI8_9ASCO